MTNYKKSLLSVAAACAIVTTVATADYIPLTSTTVDDKWVLFGVSGFVTTGEIAGEPNVFSITDKLANSITDDANDEVAVAGLKVSGGNLGTLKATADGGLAPVEIRVNTEGINYIVAQPVHTMYVSVSSGSTPAFSFEYKEALEGKKLQYTLGGGTAYEIIISDEYFYESPGVGAPVTGEVDDEGEQIDQLTSSDDDALDYNFNNNPIVVSQYNVDDHRNDKVNERARLHTYDARTKTWGTFDTANEEDTNNFSSLVKGKGYWGKIDTNKGLSGSTSEAGVVLVSSSITATDYKKDSVGLTDGWNLLAFSNSNTEIKKASTGMIVEVTPGLDANATFVDSSGNHDVTIEFGTAENNNTATISRHINAELEKKKIQGDLPYTFDLKAFPSGAAGSHIALISNKRFSIKDKDGDFFGTATTLAGQKLWDLSTDDYAAAAPQEVTTNGLRSIYGEYSMIVDPLTGTGTASALTGSKATVNVNIYSAADSSYATADTSVVIESTNAQAAANFVTAGLTATEIGLDLNSSTVLGQVLLSHTAPFYVRDHTFTRVFKYEDTNASGTIEISGTGQETIAAITLGTAATDTVATLAAGLDTQDANLGVGNDGDKLIFVVDMAGGNEFEVLETSLDQLTHSTSSSDLAKGAVKGVYSLGTLAKKGLKHTLELNVTDAHVPDDINDSMKFTYTTLYGDFVGKPLYGNPALIAGTRTQTYTSPTDDEAMVRNYVELINEDLMAKGLTSTASFSWDTDLNTTVITVSGSDVIDIKGVASNDDSDNNATFTMTFDDLIDTNETNISFEGIVIDLNNSTIDWTGSNTAKQVNTEFWRLYDANTTGSWTISSTDSNATLDFEKNATGSITEIDANSFTYSTAGTAPTATVTDFVNGWDPSTAEPDINATSIEKGYLTNTTADLVTDLKYNTIYSPNYVMDGPIFVLKEAGYRLKGLVSGTMDLTDGSIDWDSIDLTRPPSDWLDSQDYNLFDTDSTSGYWANLEADATDPGLSITGASLSKNYTYHFDTAASTGSGFTTYNYFSGNLSVTVSGIDYTIDDAKSARVVATINGQNTELTRDGSGSSYSGKISYYETDGLAMNTALDITVRISDGLGNKASIVLDSTALNFDNTKPNTPTLVAVGGGLSITTDDNTTAGYYVFDNSIPEKGTAAAAIANSANPTDICKDLADVDYDSAVGAVLVLAVDGTGILGAGNASDAASIPFMPIAKDRVKITDTGDGVLSSDVTYYDETCAVSTAYDANITTGVAIEVLEAGQTASLAYTSLGDEGATAITITHYVTDGADVPTRMQINYPETYIGKDAFINIGSQAYRYKFATEAVANASNSNGGETSLLSDKLTGISF